MLWKSSVLAFALLTVSPAAAVTVEEILALKKAGVSEETIRMLIEQEENKSFPAERLGTHVTEDGRVIRSTGRSLRHPGFSETNMEVVVYPSSRHRFRPRR